MKNQFILTLLCSFIFQFANSQDWVLQHPFSTLSTIRDIEMHSDGLGYAVGDDGIILVTSNFGTQWELRDAPHSSPYRYIHSMTGTNGQIVLAGGQKLVRSTDFGNTWNPVATGLNNIQSFHSLDENVVYLTTIQQGVHKSMDGGATWIEIENIPGTNHEDIYFFNENHGIVTADVGDDYKFIVTEDAGVTWTQSINGYPFLQRMDFANEMIGFAVGPLSTLKTTDGGKTWFELMNSPEGSNDVVAIDTDTIWTLRGLGYNFSTDGGNTWSDHGSPNGGGNTQGIFALDGQKLWITQANTAIKYTSDGGETWKDQVGGPKGPIKVIDMLDADFGIAGSTQNYILKTEDGGAIWETIPIIENTIINDLHIIDIENFLVAGRGGMLRSEDGGENWTVIPNLEQWIEKVHYISNDRIFLGGISGDIIKTNLDGDQVVMVQNLGSQINGIEFLDNTNGIAITRNGLIYQTKDGGDNWTIVYDDGGELTSTYAVTDQIILVTRRFDQNILRSEDGGDTWELVNLKTSTFWGGFSFYDSLNGYLVGGSATQGIILKTEDAGLTWENDYTTGTSFTSVDAPAAGERLIWAAGNGGQIVRYSDCNIAPKFSNLSKPDLVCQHDTVNLEVTFEGVDIFEWTVPPNFTIIGNDASARIQLLMGDTNGTVGVIGRNSCGEETQVLEAPLDPLPNPDATITQSDMILVCETEAIGYQWLLNGNAIETAQSQEFTPIETGVYTVIITSVNGCTSRPSNAIEVIITNVNEIHQLGVTMFPNPVQSEFVIQGLQRGDDVDLLDINGKHIKSLDSSSNSFIADDISAGVYFLRILRGGKQGTMKMVVR